MNSCVVQNFSNNSKKTELASTSMHGQKAMVGQRAQDAFESAGAVHLCPAGFFDSYSFNKLFHKTVLSPPVFKKNTAFFTWMYSVVSTLCPRKTIVVKNSAKEIVGGWSYYIKSGGCLYVAQLAIDKTQKNMREISSKLQASMHDVIEKNNIREITCHTYDKRLVRLYRAKGFKLKKQGKYLYSLVADAKTFLQNLRRLY